MASKPSLIIQECYHNYNYCLTTKKRKQKKTEGEVVAVEREQDPTGKDGTGSGSDGSTSACCNACQQTVNGHRSTTSNYRRHVREKHKAEWERFIQVEEEAEKGVPVDQQTLHGFMTKFNTSHPQQKRFLKSVALNLIVDCDLPMHIVERKGFIQHHITVNPKLNTLNRRAIQSVLDESTVEIENTLKRRLAESDTVSLTMDIWSDRQMRGYMGITVHYLQNRQLKSGVLSVDRFSGSHTGDNIQQHYTERATKFGIEGKVAYVVTDNASNMRKAFATLNDAPDPEEDNDEEWTDVEPQDFSFLNAERVACFAHSLQLVVKDGLADKGNFSQAIARCSRLSTLLHSSTSFKEAFEEKFGSQGIPASVDTRWNSTLRQVESVVKKGMAELNDISRREKRTECLFTAREWARLEELIKLLRPYCVATDLLQADKSVTISMVVPEVLSLYKHTVAQVEALVYLQPTARTLRDSLMKRFLGIFARVHMGRAEDIAKAPFGNKIYFLATILDPNYQLFWIDDEVELVDEIDDEPAKQRLRTELKELLCNTAEQWFPVRVLPPRQPLPAASETEIETDTQPEEPRLKSLKLKYLAKRKSEPSTSVQVDRSVNAQFGAYVKHEHVIGEDGIETLKFWSSEEAKVYPTLLKVAMRVMTVPASSAAIERVFSHGSLALTSHRSRMSDSHLSQLVLLKCNRL